MSFRWQTGDGNDDPLAPLQMRSPRRGKRRRRLTLLALLVLVTTGVFFTWRNVCRRAEATEARIKEAVLSIHQLALNGAAADDSVRYCYYPTIICLHNNHATSRTYQAAPDADIQFG